MKTPSSISSSLALCLALALPCVSTSALADLTAFDTITGSTVETWGNWFGYRASMNDNTVVAYRFVSQATGYVTGLSATISLQDAPGTVGLSLYADNAGEVGSFIRALPVQSANWHAGAPFAEGSYTGGPLLQGGAAYWIVTPLASPMGNWDAVSGTQPPGGKLYLASGAGAVGSLDFNAKYNLTASDARGLKISVSAVPEASALELAVFGALVAVAIVRHRRRAA